MTSDGQARASRAKPTTTLLAGLREDRSTYNKTPRRLGNPELLKNNNNGGEWERKGNRIENP